MAQYCTVNDVQLILPDGNVIGNSFAEENTVVLYSDVEKWIQYSSGIIDSQLNTIYRVPLIPYKEPDYSQNPITFISKYPDPIPIICAKLTAGYIYDEIIMAAQSPNISEWGKNQRLMAHDFLRDIRSGLTRLRNQPITNFRFVRGSLYDDPRVSRPGEFSPTQRNSGT